jgi:NADH-quinone oxidoreductase subunit L
LLKNKYYLDELYDRAIVHPLVALSERVLYRGVDVRVIDGAVVNGSARAVRALANYGFKYAQSGLTQGYLFVMVLGALVLVAYLMP